MLSNVEIQFFFLSESNFIFIKCNIDTFKWFWNIKKYKKIRKWKIIKKIQSHIFQIVQESYQNLIIKNDFLKII